MKLGPLEIGPSGLTVYQSEVEAGDTTPYRPRRKLCAMESDRDVDFALAKLFAASPDLLGALQAVLAEADFGSAELEARCRAAIAKAGVKP